MLPNHQIHVFSHLKSHNVHTVPSLACSQSRLSEQLQRSWCPYTPKGLGKDQASVVPVCCLLPYLPILPAGGGVEEEEQGTGLQTGGSRCLSRVCGCGVLPGCQGLLCGCSPAIPCALFRGYSEVPLLFSPLVWQPFSQSCFS